MYNTVYVCAMIYVVLYSLQNLPELILELVLIDEVE
jgi:hypothetical protein